MRAGQKVVNVLVDGVFFLDLLPSVVIAITSRPAYVLQGPKFVTRHRTRWLCACMRLCRVSIRCFDEEDVTRSANDVHEMNGGSADKESLEGIRPVYCH
jgi:hypothetical protein